MFIYTNIGNSKFVEMYGDASDIYPPALVFNTRHQVNITIYQTVYLHPDMCKVNAYPIKKIDCELQ
jgi:hypothetical protein